jgi:hypothetical protein
MRITASLVFQIKARKMASILRYLVNTLEPGKQYTEKEVNTPLFHYSDSTAFLRRSLIEFGLMDRQGGGLYWRIDGSKPFQK